MGVRARLLVSTVALVGASVLVANAVLRRELEALLIDRIRADLLVRLELLERDVSAMDDSLFGSSAWQRVASDYARRSKTRVTIFRHDGVVIGDSSPAVGGGGGEPEVAEAMLHGFGSSTRLTSGERMLHVAVPFRREDVIQGVVRISIPVAETDRAISELGRALALGWGITLGVAVLLSFVGAHLGAKRIERLRAVARRMADGDLGLRTGVEGDDEIAELGRTLDRLAGSLGTTLDEVRADREQVRRLEAVRREFVANASHELRTPATIIKSAAEACRIEARRDVEVTERFIGIIERNADRLCRLVDELLELTRAESAEIVLAVELLDVEGIVSTVIERYREPAVRKRIAIEVSLAHGGDPVLADRRAVEDILGNLVDNAVKYCPEGARVTVHSEVAGDEITIAVIDDGPGIDADHLPHVFERFYRADAGRSRDVGGNGLGLAIVKHLAEAMRGRAGVESTAGAGARFWFTLPRRSMTSSRNNVLLA